MIPLLAIIIFMMNFFSSLVGTRGGGAAQIRKPRLFIFSSIKARMEVPSSECPARRPKAA